MLHELLMALLGYTGDLIVDRREENHLLSDQTPISDECTFTLAPDISFIDPSDRQLIEKIIALGFYYRELDRFTCKSRNLSWIRSSTAYSNAKPLGNVSDVSKVEKPSVYRRALANGIVEVLSIYRSAVLHIEQLLLSETKPILATVTQGLNKFFTILPPLYELILKIERDDIRGGQLLNLLYKRCHCGVPELQTCMQRLLWHAHQVMYNQLASWMVYGILQDQHGEFFIRRQEDREVENSSSNSDISDKLARMSTNDASLSDWHLGFHPYWDMLPEYIPMHVAESILFAGKAVRVLRNPSPSFQSGDTVNPQIPKSFQKIHGLAGRFHFQREPLINSGMGEDLLPQNESDKIEAMLLDLKESSEFHKRSFECAVDSIQAIAASRLWQLVVVRADLNGHLKALKDYFLLAKGDFFQCFLEESRQLMRLPPRQSTAEADLMVPFQLAALKTIGEEDKYFSKVSLRMPSYGITVRPSPLDVSRANTSADGSSGASSEMSLDGWDGLALEYSVDWPLHLFFTQEVLSKYLRVFQYLLRLKRTQMELEKLWASVMHQYHRDFAKRKKDRSKSPTAQQKSQRSRPMWRVREHMAFLIRNLQFYIQVDVIESQWNILQTHIQDSHDFTELVGFHQEYLLALISQTFLDIGSVSRILDSIMKLCLQFCWNLENQDHCSNTVELEHIAEEFNKKSNSLYTILRSSRLAGSQRAPFLRRFLLRLNLNSFFEATARGVLNVVRPRPSLPVLNQQ
ncbi:gamma-tubulin complex component 4 homolog isoform X1 [Arachis duranensis]|uniref:Gamma-tubulin complex component n=1 Tax=Arachis duranensis TaxID=130453 RepID=A0A6P4CGI0_ARADU|nr:gamma-tubulin complex component 4 homolog isoform X1 [Arachis duranensis]